MLSGFLGAGKTTLLNHVLNNRQGMRVAVIVNGMSEVNVDGKLVGGSLSRVDEKFVETSNGCICRTLRDDLLKEVARLAEQKRFDYLLIESIGISEPMPVAATFSEDDLPARGLTAGEEDERDMSDLLIDQIEFGNVLVINKTDRMTAEDITGLRTVLHSLETILNAGLYGEENAAATLGWLNEIQGIRSASLPSRRPLESAQRRLGRSSAYEGLCWIAAKHDVMGAFSQAGNYLEPQANWYAALPKGQWP